MEKNFEDISCVYCGEKNYRGELNCTSCRKELSIYSKLLNSMVENLKLMTYSGRGFYGITYKTLDRFGKSFAIKLIIKKAYQKYDKDFFEEAEKFAQLPESSTIAKYINAGETNLMCGDELLEFYFIVSEWIEGISLKEYLSNNTIVPEDLFIFATDILSSLNELYEANLWHNDLHEENIMVSQLSYSQMKLFKRTIPRIFKIIDIGSMVYRNPDDLKIKNDLMNAGSHIFKLSGVLKKRFSEFSKEDQLFITFIDEVCAQLMDENIQRNFQSPMEALLQIEKYYKLSRYGKIKEIKKLDNPYDHINANDIPSAWLITHMFSDKISYFKDIMSAGQQCLLITGPRGCGKTMILKNMRFLTIYDAKKKKPSSFFKKLQYVALFVSARTNFGNYLVSFRQQEWIKSEEKVMLYFNILITIEAIDILYRLYFDKFIDDKIVSAIVDSISPKFCLKYSSINTIKSSLVDISKNIVAGKEVFVSVENSTPSYLNDLVLTIKSSVPIFRDKEIIIMVDDLSLPRIPEIVQKSIIPSIFNTGSKYKIRITSHSEGIITQDYAGEAYNPNRDYREINLGREYWELSNQYEICRDSFNDILDKRYKLSGKGNFPGIENMLSTAENIEDIGREIYKLKKKKKLRTLRYYGSRIFIKLCTGDLSYLLDILGKMEARNQGGVLPIGIEVQNEVIRTYARNELLKLQDIKAQHVSSLHNIAYAFGTISKSKLIKSNADYLKIEVEVQNMPGELMDTLRELLCYGIFIDAGSGNNSSGKFCKRLYFRRIYTPAFPTTFITRNSFSWRTNSFKKFVERPLEFMKENMSKDKINKIEQQDIEQLELF